MKPSLLPSRSLGAREVRALAHPLRLRMLESLADGPATASMLGRELGESSGATSYHLRALASAGLIIEDLDRRKGRERWWQRDPDRVGLISSAPAEDPEYDAAVAEPRAGLYLEIAGGCAALLGGALIVVTRPSRRRRARSRGTAPAR